MKEKQKLQHAYPSIEGSYGGSQSWFENRNMSEGGCGVVAAGDLLLYLGMYRKGCRTEEMHGLFHGDGEISRPRYKRYLLGLRRNYFPVLPRLGMPYWALVLGLNRYFRKYHLGLKARWGVLPWNMTSRMEDMLRRDIPVVLAVGPRISLPILPGKRGQSVSGKGMRAYLKELFFRDERLNLYQEDDKGGLRCTARTKAHFIAATGIGDGKIKISSWGRPYVVDWEEYKAYVRRNSNYLMCNLCYIRECPGGRNRKHNHTDKK